MHWSLSEVHDWEDILPASGHRSCEGALHSLVYRMYICGMDMMFAEVLLQMCVAASGADAMLARGGWRSVASARPYVPGDEVSAGLLA